MTQAQLRNLLVYIGVALVNILAVAVAASLAAGSLPGFRDGEFLAPSKGLLIGLLAILLPILTTWLAANRPRFGSEQLAEDVGAYKELGYHRTDLTVVPKAGRVPGPTPAQTTVILTPGQLDELAERLLVLRAEHDRAEAAAPDDERRAEADAVTGTPPLPPAGRG